MYWYRKYHYHNSQGVAYEPRTHPPVGKALILISDSLPFIHVQTGSRDDTGRTEFRGGYVRGNTMIGSR